MAVSRRGRRRKSDGPAAAAPPPKADPSVRRSAAAAGAAAPEGTSPDQALLGFLIRLAVDPDFAARFNTAPEAALNDVPDLSDADRQALLDRNAADILSALGAEALDHAMAAGAPSGATKPDVRVDVQP